MTTVSIAATVTPRAPDPAARRRRGLLAAGVAARAVGLGCVLPTVAVFFLRTGVLGSGQITLGMSAASALGLLAAVPAGQLVDRIGSRRTIAVFPLGSAAVFATYPWIGTFTAFLVASCTAAVCLSATRVAEATLIQSVFSGGDIVRDRAFLGAVHNLGFGLGVLATAVPLQLGTWESFAWLLVASAAVTASSSLTLPGLRTLPPAPRTAPAVPPKRTRGALADLPYLFVAVLTGLTLVYNHLLTIAAPLWILEHTDAPRATSSTLLAVNALMVVGLQVTMSRGSATMRGALRGNTRGGVLLAAGCLLFALGGAAPRVWLVVGALVAATVALTLGELWTTAAAWNFGYGLADPRAPGAYQGIYGLGRSLADLLGPAAATGVVALGPGGWALAGCYFIVLTLLVPVAVRRAHRAHRARRPADRIPVTEPAL